jgi:hypothetical protein
MGSITSWLRLEPRCRDDAMTEGLRARVHDPLWLLARQWQVGEYRAEDAGSPMLARWRAESAPLTRVHQGAIKPNTNESAAHYDVAALPLEAMVERQRVQTSGASSSLRLAVESGLQLLRLIDAQPTSKKYRAAFTQRFALAPPTDAEREALDAETLGWWSLMAGRAPDGRAIAAALRGSDGKRLPLPAELKIAKRDRAEIDVAVQRWFAEQDALFSEPSASAPDAWQSDRMEYAFTVAGAHGAEGETALSATQYCEGRLDWSSVDIDLEVNLGSAADVAVNPASNDVVQTTVPAPVSFRGMPAPRFWEFEDARIDWGLIDAGPGDLPHLLLADFATNFGNDWYVIPVEIDVGTLTRTRSLVVTDTFGVQMLVRPVNDPAIAPAKGFSMFQLGAVQRAAAPPFSPQPNLFFLAPAVAKTLEGRAVEEVLLLRDEIANMAWAVERAIPGPLEQRLDLDAVVAPGDAAAPPPDGQLRYRLATDVPANWVPLLPQRDTATNGLRLVRAAMLAPDGSNAVRRARGVLLNPPGPGLALFDEEVPREGARITRSAQHVRWFGGSAVLWIGLRNMVGKGEGSSGLRFDIAEDN